MTDLLVLGGSGFVGRSVVEAAVARGWTVTVLNRGHRPAPDGVEALVGDRSAPDGLAALGSTRTWDAVVDTWAAAPRVVRVAASALADRVDRYAYVSSRSVYAQPTKALADEDAPVVEGSADDGEDVDYARAKRGGELAALAAFGDRALLVRAGLILGPYEDVGRLPWWLARMARGGPVVAPAPPGTPVQYIDARDLATWTLDAVLAGRGGPFNLVCPPGHATIGEVLEAAQRVTGREAELRWIEPEVLLAAGVEPWTQLPIWLPSGPSHDFMHHGDVAKALAAGLHCRPVSETVADTWAWLQTLEGPVPQRPDRPPVGLPADLEAELLR